jgi:hypothetical protein
MTDNPAIYLLFLTVKCENVVINPYPANVDKMAGYCQC